MVVVAAVGAACVWTVLKLRSIASFPALLVTGAAAGFNALVITLDTTRADHLVCYGYEGAATPLLGRRNGRAT